MNNKAMVLVSSREVVMVVVVADCSEFSGCVCLVVGRVMFLGSDMSPSPTSLTAETLYV